MDFRRGSRPCHVSKKVCQIVRYAPDIPEMPIFAQYLGGCRKRATTEPRCRMLILHNGRKQGDRGRVVSCNRINAAKELESEEVGMPEVLRE
jgi:hypothetical protein